MEGLLLKEKLKYLVYSVDRSQPNIFFMHIPKTGGTSVDIAISRFYRINLYKLDPISSKTAAKILADPAIISSDACNMFVFRQYLALQEMVKGTKYITGHVRFNLDAWEAFNSLYAYVTVLRDPVKRYISEYYFNAFRKDEDSQLNIDLATFMESQKGKDLGCTYVNYLANNSVGQNISIDQKLAAAKENLHKFKIVGFLENLEVLKEQFQSKFHLKLKIPHSNKSPVTKQKIDDNIVKKITELCQADIELYNYAKDNFSRR